MSRVKVEALKAAFPSQYALLTDQMRYISDQNYEGLYSIMPISTGTFFWSGWSTTEDYIVLFKKHRNQLELGGHPRMQMCLYKYMRQGNKLPLETIPPNTEKGHIFDIDIIKTLDINSDRIKIILKDTQSNGFFRIHLMYPNLCHYWSSLLELACQRKDPFEEQLFREKRLPQGPVYRLAGNYEDRYSLQFSEEMKVQIEEARGNPELLAAGKVRAERQHKRQISQYRRQLREYENSLEAQRGLMQNEDEWNRIHEVLRSSITQPPQRDAQ